MLLAADRVYLALCVAVETGGLLHRRFTLTREIAGGLLSVALALGSLRPPVRWGPASLQPGLSSRAQARAAVHLPSHGLYRFRTLLARNQSGVSRYLSGLIYASTTLFSTPESVEESI